MNLTQTAEKKLKAELNQVSDQLNSLLANDPARGSERDIDNEMEDDYQESEEGFRSQSLIDNVRANQKNILRALEKIGAGNYSKCDSCGNEIEKERLEALPATLTCFSCQNLREKRNQLRFD